MLACLSFHFLVCSTVCCVSVYLTTCFLYISQSVYICVCLSICLTAHSYACLPVFPLSCLFNCLSVNLSTSLSVCLLVCLLVYQPVHSFFYPSICLITHAVHLFIHPYGHLYFCPLVYLFFHPSVYSSVCLSVYLPADVVSNQTCINLWHHSQK
jgi:hypothetical protein